MVLLRATRAAILMDCLILFFEFEGLEKSIMSRANQARLSRLVRETLRTPVGCS